MRASREQVLSDRAAEIARLQRLVRDLKNIVKSHPKTLQNFALIVIAYSLLSKLVLELATRTPEWTDRKVFELNFVLIVGATMIFKFAASAKNRQTATLNDAEVQLPQKESELRELMKTQWESLVPFELEKHLPVVLADLTCQYDGLRDKSSGGMHSG